MPEVDPNIVWYIPKRQPSLARRKYDFLRCLLRWGTISEAAARIGIDRRTAQRWRQDDPKFDEDCRIRLEWRREAIILAASNRLEMPTRRPIFRGGRQIGHLERANDKILLALLKTIAAPRRKPVTAGRPNVPLGATSRSAPNADPAVDAKG
ncbi:MAG: hypothetical protein Q8L22_00195 [Reyranella sp.]|nr:hypothetical protein [Reyranella sp.]